MVFALFRCERLLYQYGASHPIANITGDDACSTIEFQFHLHHEPNTYTWLFEACALHCVDFKICERIVESSQPILLRLFMCFFYKERKQIMRFVLLKEHMLSVYDMVEKIEFAYHVAENGDVTYEFLEFLTRLELNLFQGMVSLKGIQKNNILDMDAMELSKRYPRLSMTQIMFYMKHRTLFHYYTIANFMEFANVCYETARCSMDEFVSMHWYQKQKMGKKFVYYICGQ